VIDIHSHILPGVDDGSENFEESLELIRMALACGVHDIILTPHFMFGTEYNVENEKKILLYHELKQKILDENINVNLYLGNEVFVENNMLDLLKQNKILTLNNSKYLLFEVPRHDEFRGLYDIVFELETNGITPILAHPERYRFIMENPSVVEKLKEQGVLFQSNLSSFLGVYGKQVQETAFLLMKHHCVEFIASDIHKPKHCHYKNIEAVQRLLKKFMSADEILEVFETNPAKVIKNEIVEVKEIVPFKKNLFGKWK